MMIRALNPSDIDELRNIHARHFLEEFEFPDFLHNFLCCFVVVNNQGNIVSGGGVRLIAESVILTNKDYAADERRAALYQILDASEYVTKKADFNHLHAVTDNTKWMQHLSKVGFQLRGNALALKL